MKKHVTHLIERHFCDELQPDQARRMRAHLRTCPDCERAYDALASALRLASREEPTGLELARWSARLQRRLPGGHPPPAPAPAAAPWYRGLLAPALGSVLALLAVSAGVLLAPLPPGGPAWQARGGARIPRTAPGPLVALELFAVGGPEGRPRRLADGDRVDLGAFLQARYRNLAPAGGAPARHLYLLALDPRLKPLDHHPRPSQGSSVAVRPAPEARSVGRSIRLAKRHRAGPLWVVALFSDEPLTRERVHGWLARRVTRGLDLARLGGDRTLGPGVYPVVRRLVLVQEPAPRFPSGEPR